MMLPYCCLRPPLTGFHPAEVEVPSRSSPGTRFYRRHSKYQVFQLLDTHTPKWGQGVFFTDGCGSLIAVRPKPTAGARHPWLCTKVNTVKGEVRIQRASCEVRLKGKALEMSFQFHVCRPVWSPFTSAGDG